MAYDHGTVVSFTGVTTKMKNRYIVALLCFMASLSLNAAFESDSLTFSGQTMTAIVTNKTVSGGVVTVTIESSWGATSTIRPSQTFDGTNYVSPASTSTPGTRTSSFSRTPAGGNQNYAVVLEYRNGSGATLLASKTFTVNLSTSIQAQTVTISSASSDKLVSGQTRVFTASGGNTSYVWAATGGSLTGTGSSRTYTAGATPGTYSVSVYAIGSGGYSQSNTATASVPVVSVSTTDPTKRKLTLLVENTSRTGNLVATAVDAVTGVTYGSLTVAPGSNGLMQIQKIGNNAVNVVYSYPNGASIVSVLSDSTASLATYPPGYSWTGDTLTDSQFADDAVPYVAPVEKKPVTPTNGATGYTGVTAGTAVTNATSVTSTDISNVGFSTAPGTGTVTDATYKEGVSALTRQLQSINDKLESSSGGTTPGSNEGVETRLDDVNDNLVKLQGDKPLQDAALTYGQSLQAKGASANADVSGWTASATSAASGVASSSLGAGVASMTGSPIPANNSYALQPKTISTSGNALMQQAFGSDLDVNPFSSAKLQAIMGISGETFMAWIRNFIAWASIFMFVNYVLDTVLAVCRTIAQTPSTTLSPSATIALQTSIFGNNVGVAISGAMWGLQLVAISTAVLASPAIISGILYTTFDLESLIPLANSSAAAAATGGGGSSGSLIANILSYSYLILPVSVLVTIAINSLLLRLTTIVQTVIINIGLKLATSI